MNENEWEDLKIAADKVRLLGGTPDVRPFLKAVEYVEDLKESVAEAENETYRAEEEQAYLSDKVEELESKIENLEREKALLESNIEDLEIALEDLERRHGGCP